MDENGNEEGQPKTGVYDIEAHHVPLLAKLIFEAQWRHALGHIHRICIHLYS